MLKSFSLCFSVRPVNKKSFLQHVEDLCASDNAKFQEEFAVSVGSQAGHVLYQKISHKCMNEDEIIEDLPVIAKENLRIKESLVHHRKQITRRV